MSALMTNADMAHLQSLYPFLNLQPLTAQQERFVLAILRGGNVAEAEAAVGYSKGTGKRLLNTEEVQAIIKYFQEHTLKDIRVTRDSLTLMLLESHAKAGSATEEVMAVRELGKMHGLYESDNQRATRINNNTLNMNAPVSITNAKQLERMGQDELLKLAQLPSLDPVPLPVTIVPRETIVDAEFTEGD